MTAKYTIATHLEKFNEFVKDLEHYSKIIDKKRFLKDKGAQKIIERLLQQALEVMISVGEMIIAEETHKKPEKHDEVFNILARDLKVYPGEFADQLWGFGSFRNILVHNYITININKVYNNFVKGVPLFKQYAKYIAKYLKKR